ncbi:GNAT family N-acetyltransferase [Pseudactinotalea terrae]|uniref:GNAT family N-acetyltransferase n=1 Tax=Pseudactinotalea terrae TaxID=1743262 RepID=UPI0012E2CB0A|nr:GNAT family N-acetyltransferase [Pseudactinotalea terrae]
MALTWRPATLADVPALTVLANAAIEADGTGRPISEAAVAEQLEAPRFDPATDSVTVWEAGDLVAAGTVWAGSEPVAGHALTSIGGDVHPAYRRRGIGRELLARLERRGIELAGVRHPGLPIRLRSAGGTPDSPTQRLLEHAGYRPDNYFITMEVDLPAWEDPGHPSAAVAIDPEALLATREAHNDAFRDHRNSSAIPEDVWVHWMGSGASRPDMGRVVLDDDRRVLAYALVGEHQPGVAHVELLGTRREARGRGLARQVLLGTLRAAREAGYAVAELEVDSTSPTGADRLYATVGFLPVRTISRYQRSV